MTKQVFCLLLALAALGAGPQARFQNLTDGTFVRSGRPVFPIGSYELPKSAQDLKAMADAGINLVRCAKREDLDRAQAAGLMGWMVLPLQSGTRKDGPLHRLIEETKGHPALALWEGPDELVWHFTAASALYRQGFHTAPGEWWQQTPKAIEWSEKEAAKIIPQLLDGIGMLRRLDRAKLPIWINEAARSDMKFIRQYIDAIDVTGCDIYPINEKTRKPGNIGEYTDRYRSIGKGRPVYMVLQGFSWNEITPPGGKTVAYPSFLETRMMAWNAIAHGARGIFYWGTYTLPFQSEFRKSIYAMTSELAALQPFLVAPEEKQVRIGFTESDRQTPGENRGVRLVARRSGQDWLLVLVNEANHFQMGVELTGLEDLNGRKLELLYGAESAEVKGGEFITRLRPLEVKIFSSSRKWEAGRPGGREYGQ